MAESNFTHFKNTLKRARSWKELIKIVEEHSRTTKSNDSEVAFVIDWLDSDYNPVSHGLTAFEKDLLSAMPDSTCLFGDYPELLVMKEKGHYKDVPTTDTIKDILDTEKDYLPF